LVFDVVEDVEPVCCGDVLHAVKGFRFQLF
jgi:hypothetical protein